MPPSTAPSAQGAVLQMARYALLIAFLFLFIAVPSATLPDGPGLDSSWRIGLNLAHAQHLTFGRDIIFTYGPLGYLLLPTFPEAEPWAAFALAWGIALVTVYALWRVCRHGGHWTAVCLYLGVFWISSAFLFDFSTERLLAAALALSLAIVVRLDAKPWFDVLLLSLLGALTLLVKFNLGILATSAAFYFVAWLAWRSRPAARTQWTPAAMSLMVWFLAFAGLYWASNGTPAGIPAFLRNSAQVAGGYSDAMSWPGEPWISVTALATCLILPIAVPLLSGEWRRMAPAIPLLAVIVFLCFKSAMVRQDFGHATPFQFEMSMAALLLLGLASTPRSRIVVGAFAVVSLALGVAVVTQIWPAHLHRSWNRFTGYAALQNLDLYLHWPDTVDLLAAQTDETLLPDRLPAEFLPSLAGKRVAVWQPLPVLQAYSAYTPSLELADAGALERSDGPEKILLEWTAIDRRYPFYEAPRSWQALVDWYDISLETPEMLILQRRATRRFDLATPAGGTVAQWGETIMLPYAAGNEILIMQPEIPESLFGIVRHTLFRSNVIEVVAVRESGLTSRGRVVRANLPDGVIASDNPRFCSDLDSMMAAAPEPFRDRVVAIRFETAGPAEYGRAIRIRWFRRLLRR